VSITAERLTEPARVWRRGAALVAGATLVWSSAGLLSRMVPTAPWTTLFWRSVFAGLAVLAYLVWRDGSGVGRGFARLGRVGWMMALCFAASMICFITALDQTTVAAVLVFQAAAPLFAAAFAWLLLRESVSPVKLAAILLTLVGVLVMVSGSGAGRLVGNALSAAMGLTYAATVVLARMEKDVPTTHATALALLLVALVSLPFASLDVAPHDMGLLAVFGVVQMGIALVMFTAGVRLIPAADAGLISVLEAVLAPAWVWLAFAEDPGQMTLLGGAIVVVAVLAACWWDRRSETLSRQHR
jgi:drug/metabolite transporter (DMT)-like permease